MLVIPSLDLQKGRSRLVWWPGASTGLGAPTDRPGIIAAALVAQGAPAIHLVDLDGAQQGRPANLEAIGGVARAVAKPLQVAGGIDGPEQIEMAFAAGATRVVLPLWAVVEDRPLLVSCLDIAGDWLAVGLDARPESLSGYPWRHRSPPRLGELVFDLAAAGVRRFVFSHLPAGGAAQLVASLPGGLDADVLVAGGVVSLDEIKVLRDVGVSGVILGEALFTGQLDLGEALRSAA
jgi:phosphoribosylformimino-5-aminoimidazole carboxamide ribotide isomerase